MPPRLQDYTLNDWLHLRPFTHTMKTRRYRAIDRDYSRLPATSPLPPGFISSLNARRVLVSIAFADPQTIDWQAQLVKLYVPDVLYVVADNTTSDLQAAEIASVAEKTMFPTCVYRGIHGINPAARMDWR
ncbi:hypothetical protein [Afipia birgiae]|uniref:hypothetical protein n=1 Tax=Afipia birgiae TaxID=151414 RepID=UPI001FCB5A4C|nr:hypothetical protein [Afipia birgiae]